MISLSSQSGHPFGAGRGAILSVVLPYNSDGRSSVLPMGLRPSPFTWRY